MYKTTAVALDMTLQDLHDTLPLRHAAVEYICNKLNVSVGLVLVNFLEMLTNCKFALLQNLSQSYFLAAHRKLRK